MDEAELIELQKRICYPPDPNPKKPKVPAPPGSCDTHAHLFGPPHMYPYQPKRVYTPPAAPLQHYIAMLDTVGIDRAVMVTPNAHGTDNSVTFDAIAASNGRFRGVAKIDDGTSDDELERLHRCGFRGARFNCIAELGGRVDLAMFERCFDRMASFGWHVVFHVMPNGLLELRDWFRKIPIPVVIDHFARVEFADGIDQPAYKALLELMREDHVWSKICCADRQSATGYPYDDAIPFAEALIEVAPERLMWGTDWPHSSIFEPGHTPNDGDLVDLMARLAPDMEIRRRIMVTNPARLYGFEG